MVPRPFRFGVQMSRLASRREWVDRARKAQDLGYAVLTMPDHFGDQLAPVPALMALADATDLRIGTMVLDNDYRHPLVLAKEAATLDVLSDGRLEVGLGAGWMRRDYEQAGIPYDPPAVRVDRFEEGLAVVKGLLSQERLTFAGRHYTVDHALRPRPVQQPRPPVLVGGGGPRVLGIAAREADVVGVNFDLRAGEIQFGMGPDGTAEAVDRKIAWVREAAGERFADLELSIQLVMAVVTDDRRSLVESVVPAFGLTADQALAMPPVLVGTVDQMAEDLRERRERFGFSYLVVSGDVFESLGPVVARLAGT